MFREFSAKKYINDKVTAINKFLEEESLNAVVVGLSGGIDSAVVYKILQRCNFEKVVGLVIPIHGDGTSGQDEATRIGIKIGGTLFDATSAYNSIKISNNSWANGQMASVLRTPILYYQAALLQTEGFKSIVCGTTNMDEGAYIGFYGKASDGMVDLQPIADIHKSEVYEIAKELNVDDEIISRRPMGDVWNNKNDEEMIGAPYCFLEKYIESKIHKTQLILSPEEEIYASNIEKLHTINKHKYKVGSPARYVDVMPKLC